MRICCISDLHTFHRQLVIPECELLIVAGDISYHGEEDVLLDFAAWLHDLELFGIVKTSVVVAGNHDTSLDVANNEYKAGVLEEFVRALPGPYLNGEMVDVLGCKVYGSPMSASFGQGWAFQLDRGAKAKAYYAGIPDSADVVVTHGPAYGYGDKVPDFYDRSRRVHVGCSALRDRLEDVRPQLHVFGHIHEGAGRHETGYATAVNASVCTRAYKPTHQPILVEL